MRKSRVCSSLDKLGGDIKSARTALHLTRRDLAEQVGIDPRYLANIENSGSMPSLPIFYELVRICKLPLERYFLMLRNVTRANNVKESIKNLPFAMRSFYPW